MTVKGLITLLLKTLKNQMGNSSKPDGKMRKRQKDNLHKKRILRILKNIQTLS